MKLTEIQIIQEDNKYYNDLLDLMHKSKNLYNAALYTVRQHYLNPLEGNKKEYLDYYNTREFFTDKKHPNSDFYALPSVIAQQVLMQLDRNFKSFFKLLKKKKEGKYNKRIHIPDYLDKDGYNLIVINTGILSKDYKKDGTLIIPTTNITFKIENYKTCKQVRFVPCTGYIKLEAIYEFKEDPMKIDNGKYLSIDLGIDNLCACVSISEKSKSSFLIDGKKLKSINQRYNKHKAELQSRLPENKHWSNQLNDITKKRNFRINNYLHEVSKYIVNHAVSNNINTIVIGYNKEWKQDTNMSRKNNQNFIQIPFQKLIQLIKYKAKLKGIKAETQEESNTSKASFFDNDEIPTYKKNKHAVKYKFSGKRKNRGLYITSTGLKINADINGSLNILRKYLKCNSDAIIQPADKGFVVNPVRIKIYNYV